MSVSHDARLEIIRELTGIGSPSLGECSVLRTMQILALQLIAATEREIAGIRDGDGFWCGADPVTGFAQEIAEKAKELRQYQKDMDGGRANEAI